MLRYELLGRGIDPESIDAVTGDIDDRTTAVELARRKARSASSDDYTAFIARVGGFLRRRGFDYSVAAEATRMAWAEVQERAARPGPLDA
jgi:SOS response regulatory protein OraA/RecX